MSKRLSTAMIYTHFLNSGPGGVRGPAGRVGLWPMVTGSRLRITTSGRDILGLCIPVAGRRPSWLRHDRSRRNRRGTDGVWWRKPVRGRRVTAATLFKLL